MIEQALMVLFVFMIFLNLSWIVLYFLPSRKTLGLPATYPSVSIILPAHNEEGLIREAVKHCLDAQYPSCKEVMVVNDGSTDQTARYVEELTASDKRVRLISIEHSGKANAINTGLKEAAGDVIVIIDADSKMAGNALMDIVAPFSDPAVGASSGVIRAEMNNNLLVWYQDVEYMMSSTWRYVCNKLSATYLLPGYTAFRKDVLVEIGGFKRDTLSEDFEVGLRMKKAGYVMVMTSAVMFTSVPQTFSALIRQRVRWSRGTLQVARKHSDMLFNPKYGAVGIYGIPTQLYWFLHGSIALPITAYQILFGYMAYFVRYNDVFSLSVLNYFFGWFSVYGMLEYSYNTFTGVYPMTWLFMLCFVSFCLGNIYMLLAITRYSRLTLKHAVILFFYFPYSLFCLVVTVLPAVYEISRLGKDQRLVNRWNK